MTTLGLPAKVRDFLGAESSDEVIFVRGTSEAINLVTSTYGRQHVGRGDEVLISESALQRTDVHGQSFCDIGDRRDPASAGHKCVYLGAHQQPDIGRRR